ncbi:MAG: nucleotidyltransferase family protein [Pseudomonadota bacterium]
MSRMPDTAMVLAAGLGTRMRPLTDTTPKPLIKVAGKALIDYALDQFADAGVRRAVVNVHYLADQIETHLKSREAPEIIFSDEREELMETGGGLKKAQLVLGDAPIFCTNTDAIIMRADGAGPCAALSKVWDAARMDALLLLVPIAKASGYDGRGDFDQH